MNMGFVNVAIAKEDRVPTHALTPARLFENHEVAITRTRAETVRHVGKHKTHAF